MVAWVAAEGPYGYELGLKWIESKKELVASTGWATLSSVVALTDDAKLDLATIKKLLQRVAKTIHDQPNAVRSAMNNFVIAVGSYVASLTDEALRTGSSIGEVYVDMGNTSCKVPAANDSIGKVKKRGALGKKRKTVKC